MNRILAELARVAAPLVKLGFDMAVKAVSAYGRKVAQNWNRAHYYRGGFESEMTKQLACSV